MGLKHALLTVVLAAGFLAALTSAAKTDSIAPLPMERATLELHAHLFMKEGMTWFFRGEFDGPLQATDWTQRFSSQANPESMNLSEMGVVVVALYAHPLFTLSLRDSIRKQIELAEKFSALHPEWVIARDAAQARLALDQGKRVLVLALEGAAGVIENEQDLKEFVDEKGIRIVNLLHLTDDQFGGVAFMPGIKILASPLAWLGQALSPQHAADGTRINANGLSNAGRAMAQSLMQRHVWIDLAHASDRSIQELTRMHEKDHLPLLYTHTVLRKYMGAERGISLEQLQAVKQSEGVLGVMPSDDMLGDTAVVPGPKTGCDPSCKLPCKGGLHSLAQQYSEITAVLDPAQVSFGSDYNGGVHHLQPTCPLGTALDKQGLWNIGLQAAVWDSLQKMGQPVPTPRRKMIDHFLLAWEKINPSKGSKP